MAISDYIEDLIYRVLSGEAGKAEREEFEEWLSASEEHQMFFREVERAWHTGKYTLKWENVQASEAWQALERKHDRRRRNRVLRICWRVAAAVVVVVGTIFAFWQLDQEREPGKVAQGTVVKAGESKAVLVLSTGEKIVLGESVSDLIREGGMSIRQEKEQINYDAKVGDLAGEVVYNELIVPVGGEYRLLLSDGTMVYMNSESRLKYPVCFVGDKRVVELEGEAYFDVARDEKCPFIVHTNLVNVDVLGTSFNVMAYKVDNRIEVTLVKGKVNVTCGEARKILEPNQQFVLNNENGECVVREVNVDTFIDWKNGILNFDALPLGELSEKLGRWYGVKFFFTNEKLKQLKFSGAVKKYNDIDYILSLIEATTNVTFTMKADVIIVNEK